MKLIAFGLLGIGFALLLLSGLWASLFPGTATWTPEKADQWAKIQTRIHNLAPLVNNPSMPLSMHTGTDLGPLRQEYDQLRKESDVFKTEFESAHDRPLMMARILKWSGISLAVIGVIGLYALNQSR